MPNFISYAHQTLSAEQIAIYAEQYTNVDMWQLTGQDENYFPFLIGTTLHNYRIVYWSKKHGIIDYQDPDPVRYYAFVLWLEKNIHPDFATIADATRHASERDWPRFE
jgi:hypothetical protein